MSTKLSNGITVPEKQEWRTEDLSLSNIADYKPFIMVDGPGVRCSVYVSGCKFLCPGCYNVAAQNFNYGTPYSKALEDQIIDDLRQPYVQGLTLLGGEPFLNTGVTLQLVRRVREEFGHTKDIWSWTGYTWEELLEETDDKKALLKAIDVVVDGRFIQALMDLTLRFRGSSNQRMIRVPESLQTGEIVLWTDEYDQ
ncbi:anaerobic ribonucleoside-triphosphate reductase activating protein [Weissella diestrammenae]|uniref:Anaerobic ribonucleoside-triphosphate reductase-activating protein n=1 Tax=Weissella diestrammenae TaxID=1162633 RepID=A0A7G9T5S2_9LACO|nr:anaerobic ribonucleoside-triphosphate reductase activating protein [Weissella diestrammenae]MCM0582275.1 anaerobic ribonucleoside-triphosphate reductase activating protein [Weissella diestrammenae]QNN75447.1 anaerobic ribonucleoside-triphosphate reductase activating protein [Weissella diestrammenae]